MANRWVTRTVVAAGLAMLASACGSKVDLSSSSTVAGTDGAYQLHAPGFAVALPSKPVRKPIDTGIAGFTTVAYTIEAPDAITEVLADGIPSTLPALDDSSLASTFGAVVAGIASRGGGTVTTNEVLPHPAGPARRALVSLPDGERLYAAAVAHDHLVVIVVDGGPSDRKAEYQSIVDSVRFT